MAVEAEVEGAVAGMEVVAEAGCKNKMAEVNILAVAEGAVEVEEVVAGAVEVEEEGVGLNGLRPLRRLGRLIK